MKSILGVIAYFVTYLGFAPVGNANDKCLNNCSVIAGGDHFERQSGIIYQNLKVSFFLSLDFFNFFFQEIENAEEIPVKEDDQEMQVEQRHGREVLYRTYF